MTKNDSIKKSLEQAFWQKCPTLSDNHDYTFHDLFPIFNKDEYEPVFWEMVDKNVLPLIPVIPAKYGAEVFQVALDYQ